MTAHQLNKTERLGVVDALRGFALLAIVLLHNLEHYNLFYFPDNQPSWLVALDTGVWETLFFVFAGKAYATFSLLFGFSFYIQMRNEQARGGDFRLRFAWRMFLLFLFSQLHALFYNGDILLLYSFVGLVLIAVCNLKDKSVFVIAVICLLQPLEWGRIIYALYDPDFIGYGHLFRIWADQAQPVMANGTILETIKSNIWNGQLYSNVWQVENGRLFQTAALFMFGMLLGRGSYFVKSKESTKNWFHILKYAVIAIIPLFGLKYYIPDMITTEGILLPVNIIIPSLVNFAFMAILVSGFTLLWFKRDGFKFQRFIIPYGRMSLTNYITQSIFGVIIYWGCGLGLYKYAGATFSILIAFSIFFIQLTFSYYWLKKNKQGPLESLWKKGTWIYRKNKLT